MRLAGLLALINIPLIGNANEEGGRSVNLRISLKLYNMRGNDIGVGSLIPCHFPHYLDNEDCGQRSHDARRRSLH